MPHEDKFIRAEFRFSDMDEMKTIKDELDLSDARNIAEYDGVIEAEVPLSSLEVLKKKNILMDFPSEKEMAETDNLELFNIKFKELQEEKGDVNPEWMSKFKKKAKRTYIDRHTNTLKIKTQAEEKSGDSSDDTGAEIINLPAAGGDLETMTLPDSKQEEEIAEEDLYIIIFKGPLNEKWRSGFSKYDIKLTSFQEGKSEYSYTAFLSKHQHEFLASQNITTSISQYKLEKKISKKFIQDLSENETTNESLSVTKIVDIALSDNKYAEKIIAVIESSGQAKILDSGQNIIRIETHPSSSLLAALADSPYVTSLSGYEPPSLFCDVCRKTIGLNFADAASSFFGELEVVAVIDSGIDKNHSDLKSRIKAVLQYGDGIADDLVGHGTHVAGIICGDGAASDGKIRGMAPKSQVVSIGVLDSNSKMDLPVDIGKVLKIAVDNGAKIINLSWGYKLSGEYQHGAYSVDKFIYDNPEILVVVAAGNEGKAINGLLAYKTVGVPGSAKNVLTVGAASSRRASPVINETWGNRIPASFPVPPQNVGKLISAIDQPSLISSTGPTDYDSIKPEVLAPGTYILAAKANTSAITPANPEYFDEHYTFKTGTSMAAPVVSGIAALVREYLRTVHQCNTPSSSLIKAIIIGSSHKIETSRQQPDDSSLSQVGFPDFDQGFGLIDLNNILNTKTIQLSFTDINNNDNKALESRAPIGGPVKSYREYTFDIQDSTNDLVVTLCWIDPPAKGVQNNLQLSVKSPSGEWEIGNMEHLYKKIDIFDGVNSFNLKPHDKYNNTEKILIKTPPAGKYKIKITAQNTLSAQGYSLAVLGNITGFAER